MKNVVIKNNLILILLLLILSCNKRTKNNFENKVKFKNFYEKVDSIKINKMTIFSEKFYTEKDISYTINISDKKRYLIPFKNDNAQPNSYGIKKENNKSFEINFMLGNATFYNYYFYFDENNFLNLSKIKFLYNYNIQYNVLSDSIFINKKIDKLDSHDIQKIIKIYE